MFPWTAILSCLLSSDLLKDPVDFITHPPYGTYIVYTKSCYGGTGTDNYIHNIYIINTLLELYSRYYIHKYYEHYE